MDITINRNYVHKAFGKLGTIALTAEATIILNDKELPEPSVRAILNHGLQILQDAYAGAKNTKDALASFEEKLTKLYEGTIGTRSSSDPVENKMWELAEKALRGKGLKGKALTDALDAFMALPANTDRLRPMAEAALTAESKLLEGLAD